MRVLIALFIAVASVIPLGAQEPAQGTAASATPRPDSLYRNPHRALLLGSLIPGAGHIYSGEYVEGIFIYEATVTTIGAGTLVFVMDKCMFTFLNTTTCKSGSAWPHQLLGVAIVGMGVWEWISSAREAQRAAERANARHHAQTGSVTPYVAPFSGAADVTDIGMSIHW